MSRLTESEAKGLMDAYNAVYASQEELTEEQIWEEVENWVNSLIREGYDLSEYTWEEMYESYIEEQGRGRVTGSNPNVWKPTPSTSGPGGGGMGGMRGSGRNRTATQTSSSPGALRITPTSAPAPQRPTAPAPQRPTAPDPQRPTAPAPQRPTAPAPQRPTTPTSTPNVKREPAPTTSASTPPAKPEQALSKLPGGNYSGDATKLMSQRTKNILGTTKTPAARLGGARERMLNQNFDLYDVIKGHLLDEGYADTEEAAVAIMANMSEEWKQSIVDEGYKDLPRGKMYNKMINVRMHGRGEGYSPETQKMMKVSQEHNPEEAQEKERKNRKKGGRG